MALTEILPDPAPFFVFFLPNVWGCAFAYGFESFNIEDKIASLLPEGSHPFALLGLALFALANTSSYLTGCVVCARIDYGVKLPNLYAPKGANKNAIQFNCIQRGHQNFVENLPMFIGSAFFTALVANRPNVAGVMLLIVCAARLVYAMGYRKDVKSRFPPFLVAQFAGAIGIGYGFLVAISTLGMGPMVIAKEEDYHSTI